MGDHFAAFSFVDRIHDYVPGARARATFSIPDHVPAFPSCLVAEAVGQLASWIAMAHIEFRGRPVAALALETRFLRDAQPGETLELAVELESCDDDAVAYHGWADVDGARALDLIDCLGPMLPLTEFDSPAALRERFDVLCSSGAPAGRFHGIDGFRVEPGALVPGKSATATLARARGRAVLPRPLSAPPRVSGDAAPERDDPARAPGRTRRDGRDRCSCPSG